MSFRSILKRALPVVAAVFILNRAKTTGAGAFINGA